MKKKIKKRIYLINLKAVIIILIIDLKINNKNFQKLKEIEKDYPMEAHQPFEIKENIVGAYWNFDDAENDETISDNEGGD